MYVFSLISVMLKNTNTHIPTFGQFILQMSVKTPLIAVMARNLNTMAPEFMCFKGVQRGSEMDSL